MAQKVAVGNLSTATTDEALREAFSSYGQVLDAIIMRDRDTGVSKGNGFVTYSNSGEAEAAIAELNGQVLDGNRITVTLAVAKGDGVVSGGVSGGAGGYSGGVYGSSGGYGGGCTGGVGAGGGFEGPGF
ncbi:RNA recognition motif domain-containing protein [Kitasatospora sp. NPDC057512]|uniref:RNA recognition motif domain-containing protein n=1 Tax=Kitasatospora sp. NPDC057512 TaxID=3346154 RepID=UPI00368AF313